MTAQKPTFRVKKNGYDRFAVEEAISRYEAQVDRLQKEAIAYQKQLKCDEEKLTALQAKVNEYESRAEANKNANDEMARLALREANEIISAARNNADEIIREALGTARLVLMDLSKLYNSAGEVKTDMYGQLEDLVKELDDFKLPQMPDLRWLDEAEKKMR